MINLAAWCDNATHFSRDWPPDYQNVPIHRDRCHNVAKTHYNSNIGLTFVVDGPIGPLLLHKYRKYDEALRLP